MQKYTDTVLDAITGKPISGAVITVLTYPAGTAATIFAADGGPAVPSVTTDTTGRFVFYAANGHYSYTATGTGFSAVTVNDVVLFDPSDLSASGGAGLVGWILKASGAVKRFLSDLFAERVSVKDFGAKGDGSDDSAAVLAAWTHLKNNGGGKLIFPNTNSAKYRFYLDISGTNPNIIIDFQGSKVLPVSGAAHSAILWADNQSLGFAGTNVKILDANFDGRLDGATGNGDVDYGIYLNWACIEVIGGSIQYARLENVYGNYAQYTKMTDVVLGGAVTNATSWGAYFTGPDASHRSNEVHITRCVFQSNKNGLYIGGGEKCRLLSNRFQSITTIPLQIDVDAAGNGARSTSIVDAYFEVNGGPEIKIGPSDGTVIDRAIWNTSGAVAVSATNCYNLVVRDSWGNAATASLNHPSGNSDTASVVWAGNNFRPTLSLAHNGQTFADVRDAGGGTITRDNQLVTSFQTDQGVPTFALPDWTGTKAGVAKATATSLFKLTQATWSTAQYRVAAFTVELFMWDDNSSTGQFGYSGHTQRFSVFITNNSTGNPQVNIAQETSGVDVGLSTSYQAPGSVALTAAVSGNDITFSANWPGAGTGAGGMTTQCVGYLLRGMGTNSLTMTRL